MVRAYLRAGQRFLDTHPDTVVNKKYDDVYEWFVRDLFYDSEQDWQEANNGLFAKPDYKSFLEGYFHIDLTIKKQE